VISEEKPPLVLVIDDEEAVREAVTDILEFVGMGVMTAVDGISGIERFKAHQEEIDLILLDLSMPGLNGADTFCELRKIDPMAKVILSSGYDEAEATRHFVGQGLVSFLQKPYNLPVLVNMVRENLGHEK
jgi:DNA-binding NtrC family response regulator